MTGRARNWQYRAGLEGLSPAAFAAAAGRVPEAAVTIRAARVTWVTCGTMPAPSGTKSAVLKLVGGERQAAASLKGAASEGQKHGEVPEWLNGPVSTTAQRHRAVAAEANFSRKQGAR